VYLHQQIYGTQLYYSSIVLFI